MPPPLHRLSVTMDVSSSCRIFGAPQAPGDGHVCPQPMIRVAVPTGPETLAILTGVWLTEVDSRRSARSAEGWPMICAPVVTVPPDVRLVVPTRTRTSDGVSPARQWPAVTTQSALISD